jgi:hypothetical protein
VEMGTTATFAYVANRGSNDISAYSIGSTGALTPVPGSPFAARVKLQMPRRRLNVLEFPLREVSP